MITLVGDKSSAKFIEIQEKLDSYSVQYQMKYTNKSPYLIDGEKEIKSASEIEVYLKELSQELEQWHYCV